MFINNYHNYKQSVCGKTEKLSKKYKGQLLVYRLSHDGDETITFQILHQNKGISKFLKNRNYICKETGLKVGIDRRPEFKESDNLILLRGCESHNDLMPDYTTYKAGKARAANKIANVNKALANFLKFYKAKKAEAEKANKVDFKAAAATLAAAESAGYFNPRLFIAGMGYPCHHRRRVFYY